MGGFPVPAGFAAAAILQSVGDNRGQDRDANCDLRYGSSRKLCDRARPKQWTQRNGGEHAEKLRRDEGSDARRRDPREVSESARAIVTAGFANDVDAVNQ